MFSVDCSVLLVRCSGLTVACRLSLVSCRLSRGNCCLLVVSCRVLRVKCYLSSVQCPVSSVACCLWCDPCCLSFVAWQLLRVACCVSRAGWMRWSRTGQRRASLPHRNQTFRGDYLPRSGAAWRTGAPQRFSEGASEVSEGEGCGEALLAPHRAFLEGWAGAAQIEPGFDHGTGEPCLMRNTAELNGFDTRHNPRIASKPIRLYEGGRK